MFLKVDYFFTYKFVLRFVLLQKLNFIENTYKLPFLRSLIMYFSINKIENLDDERIFNYFYLIKFFFGKRSFFVRFRSFFSLGCNYYSFNIQAFFKNRFCYFPLFFLINDLLALTNRRHYKVLYNNKCFFISFFDMNLFLEKKTNIGLFNLRNVLNFKFFISCSDFTCSYMLLNIFKIF